MNLSGPTSVTPTLVYQIDHCSPYSCYVWTFIPVCITSPSMDFVRPWNTEDEALSLALAWMQINEICSISLNSELMRNSNPESFDTSLVMATKPKSYYMTVHHFLNCTYITCAYMRRRNLDIAFFPNYWNNENIASLFTENLWISKQMVFTIKNQWHMPKKNISQKKHEYPCLNVIDLITAA